MTYILNTSLSDNKNCVIALNQVYGLGKILINQICDQLGISSQIKCKHLSANQVDLLTSCISQNYMTGADLRGLVKRNIERAIYINSFKGFRYIEKLPCRGQRTHGNAKTVRKISSSIFHSPGRLSDPRGGKKEFGRTKVPFLRTEKKKEVERG